MKHIKLFMENYKVYTYPINYEGDYALFNYETEKYAYQFEFIPELREFINNNVGRLKVISTDPNEWLSVQYDDIPKNILHKFHQDGTILLDKKNVITTAKTKRRIRNKITSKKI